MSLWPFYHVKLVAFVWRHLEIQYFSSFFLVAEFSCFFFHSIYWAELTRIHINITQRVPNKISKWLWQSKSSKEKHTRSEQICSGSNWGIWGSKSYFCFGFQLHFASESICQFFYAWPVGPAAAENICVSSLLKWQPCTHLAAAWCLLVSQLRTLTVSGVFSPGKSSK